MKIHRFYVKNLSLVNDQIILNDNELLNQILNVFRFKSGSQFLVFDGSGAEFLVEIVESNRIEVICNIKEEKMGLKIGQNLTLVFSVIKKENTELVLQKCTEIGVTSFLPVISERTVKTGWNLERNMKIVKEAVEQSGQSYLPLLSTDPTDLKDFLLRIKSGEIDSKNVVVLDFSVQKLSIVKNSARFTHILVGPEGGWTENEREQFQKLGLTSVSLGETVLRAETACISACSILLL